MRRVDWQKFIDVTKVLTASIFRATTKPRALIMEAAATSERQRTSARLHGANDPEDGHLHCRRSEKLKSHIYVNEADKAVLPFTTLHLTTDKFLCKRTHTPKTTYMQPLQYSNIT
jgi:hypothetical protein